MYQIVTYDSKNVDKEDIFFVAVHSKVAQLISLSGESNRGVHNTLIEDASPNYDDKRST